MGFVNEYMSKEDIEKYHIQELNKRFWVGNYKPQWTVDRERDAYLRYLESGRESTSARTKFYFYWRGYEILADMLVKPHDNQGGEPGSHYSIHDLKVPDEVSGQTEQIISDLKEALAVHKDAGILSRAKVFHATFDF